MNMSFIFHWLAFFTKKYAPEQLDLSLKPPDSAGCVPCRDITFDFIIVGAGGEGCVLANRLSANPKRKVLLIEAGGNEDYITDTPAIQRQLFRTKYDWNYTTVPQKHICADDGGRCEYPRGHVMGGTSTIAGFVFVRGNKMDFDEWESLGNPGWGYDDVLPYFKKSENMTVPELASDRKYHSTEGPVTISYPHFRTSIDKAYYDAEAAFGSVPTDYNGAQQIGYNYVQAPLRGGRRCSSSKAYLDPIRHRKNLYIFKNTIATRLLFDKGCRRIAGVRCVTKGEFYNVFATKEVILAAGAINTPKLLMLSGIGPKEHLEDLGISVYANLPVGHNLVDHPSVRMDCEADLGNELYTERDYKHALAEYAKNGTGFFSAPLEKVILIINSYEPLNVNTVPDVMYIGIYQMPPLSNPPSKKPTLAGMVVNINPASRGTVKLQSSDYRHPPLIDPKCFTVFSDIEATQTQMSLVIPFFQLEEFAKYNLRFIWPTACSFPGKMTLEFAKCLIKYNTAIGNGPAGTCKMGPACDKTTVVDHNLNVHTIENLRVADASIMPVRPRGTMYPSQLMIGEKASDFIINEYSNY